MFYNGLKCGGGSIDLPSLTQGTATANDIVNGKTAWVNGTLLTGALSALKAKGEIITRQVSPGINYNSEKVYLIGDSVVSRDSGCYWSDYEYFLGEYNEDIRFIVINDKIILPCGLHKTWQGNVLVDINYFAIESYISPINVNDYVEVNDASRLYISFSLANYRSGLSFNLRFCVDADNQYPTVFKPMNIKIY